MVNIGDIFASLFPRFKGFWEQTCRGIQTVSGRLFLAIEDREPPQMIAGHEQLGDTPVASMKRRDGPPGRRRVQTGEKKLVALRPIAIY